MELDEYLPVLEKANARFAEAAAEAVLAHGWAARVPGCPGWRLNDLVWHLSEVQHFWAWVVKTRAPDPSTYVEPPRHPDDELLGFLAAQNAELETVLAGADPTMRVWTWSARQDVAFVLRRQAMEATVHAVDVERTLFPGTKPFPIAALTGTAGDLLLAVWRRVPLEVLTVDGDPLQAAAMIDLIGLE
jgi:hypothetical protein